MTAGEILVSKSGLLGVSAAAHLLAIQAGSGAGETVYAEVVAICSTQDEITVTKAARMASARAIEVEGARRGVPENALAFASSELSRVAVFDEGADCFWVTKTNKTDVSSPQKSTKTTIGSQ